MKALSSEFFIWVHNSDIRKSWTIFKFFPNLKVYNRYTNLKDII
jgi:hypothetical protein